VARVPCTSAQLSYQNAKAQNADADIQAQQGVAADIDVVIGDLVSPPIPATRTRATTTVIDPDPMWLLAETWLPR
jgi:hypothetical protein